VFLSNTARSSRDESHWRNPTIGQALNAGAPPPGSTRSVT
jgi:hypothetical protein